jgi:hypothetical protein
LFSSQGATIQLQLSDKLTRPVNIQMKYGEEDRVSKEIQKNATKSTPSSDSSGMVKEGGKKRL